MPMIQPQGASSSMWINVPMPTQVHSGGGQSAMPAGGGGSGAQQQQQQPMAPMPKTWVPPPLMLIPHADTSDPHQDPYGVQPQQQQQSAFQFARTGYLVRYMQESARSVWLPEGVHPTPTLMDAHGASQTFYSSPTLDNANAYEKAAHKGRIDMSSRYYTAGGESAREHGFIRDIAWHMGHRKVPYMPPDQVALLRSIRQTPDDMGPRLVYADWVRDHGDHLADKMADHIQAHVAMANAVRKGGRLPLDVLERYQATLGGIGSPNHGHLSMDPAEAEESHRRFAPMFLGDVVQRAQRDRREAGKPEYKLLTRHGPDSGLARIRQLRKNPELMDQPQQLQRLGVPYQYGLPFLEPNPPGPPTKWRELVPGKGQRRRFLNVHTGTLAYRDTPPREVDPVIRSAFENALAKLRSQPPVTMLHPMAWHPEEEGKRRQQILENHAALFPQSEIGLGEMHRLMGGEPGSKVTLHPDIVSRTGIHMSVDHPDSVQWHGTVQGNPDLSTTLRNNAVFFRPRVQGTGMGLRTFANQAAEGARLGLDRIELTAGKGGRLGHQMNGYYTWPLFGFDGDLSHGFRSRLPAMLRVKPDGQKVKTVQDLLATPGGREHWKKHGYMDQMRFDLRHGSQSIAALNRYLTSRGHAPIDFDPQAAEALRHNRRQSLLAKQGNDYQQKKLSELLSQKDRLLAQHRPLGWAEDDLHRVWDKAVTSATQERDRRLAEEPRWPQDIPDTWQTVPRWFHHHAQEHARQRNLTQASAPVQQHPTPEDQNRQMHNDLVQSIKQFARVESDMVDKPKKQRPLPDWVPQKDPKAKTPDATGWVNVASSWIAGLRYTPGGGTEMVVKKGGKEYNYPGFDLGMFRRWLTAKSKGKFWWAHIGYPMKDQLHGNR